MRRILIATLIALGLGLSGMPTASAAPISGSAINATIIKESGMVQDVACWRQCNRWGRCWTRCNGGPVIINPVVPLVSGCAFGSHRVCNRWGRCWRVCN